MTGLESSRRLRKLSGPCSLTSWWKTVEYSCRLYAVRYWIVSPPPFICSSLNAQAPRMQPYLQMGSLQKLSRENKATRVGPKPRWLSLWKWAIWRRTHTQEECHMNVKWASASHRGKHGTDPSLTTLRRNQPCHHLDSGCLASRVKKINFCFLRCSGCGLLLQ